MVRSKYNANYGTSPLLKNRKVIQRNKDNEVIKQWDSMKEAAEHLHIKYQNISRVCRKQIKTAGGFIWEYAQ